MTDPGNDDFYVRPQMPACGAGVYIMRPDDPEWGQPCRRPGEINVWLHDEQWGFMLCQHHHDLLDQAAPGVMQPFDPKAN